jgi:ubiquinone/menaquinone biosynthesis C-methylase UbiE
MTEAMRGRAAAGATACGLVNVDVRDGDATALPVDAESIDVVISNGVLNLVPDQPRALAEIARVLKPDGRALIADIVIGPVWAARTCTLNQTPAGQRARALFASLMAPSMKICSNRLAR